MKTTLNPFENAKRTANGTGGGVSPAVIEEMQAEISILGSQNETQAQDIIDIKSSLNSINDNLEQTPITVGGEALSTIDDKLNYLISNRKEILNLQNYANQATGVTVGLDLDSYKYIVFMYGGTTRMEVCYISKDNGLEVQYSTFPVGSEGISLSGNSLFLNTNASFGYSIQRLDY